MSIDRELLELAAKAAGLKLAVWQTDEPWLWLARDEPLVQAMEHRREWRPLHDDGDALRLAAKLGIDVTYKAFGEDEVMTSASEDQFEGWFAEPYGDDKLAATRRAIVRAAAEIGRAMP